VKKCLLVIGIACLAVLVVACGGDVGTSKELNLYAWSEYIPQELLDNFTKDTGIQVNYVEYESNEELIETVRNGDSGYDLAIPSDYAVSILIRQGALEEIDLLEVPNFRNIGHEFKNPAFDPGNLYSVPYQWGTSCLVVDTSRVKREITSWADLWDPEFAGKVVLLDDNREVLSMVLSVLGYSSNSTNPAELEEAEAKLQELMPSVALVDSDSPKTALLAGQVWLGMTWSGEATLAHNENPAIDYVFPREGCSIWFDNLVILKNAPHQDASLAFINYILRPEASILITQEFPYSTPNTAALDLLKKVDPEFYADYLGFSASNPSSDDMARLRLILDIKEDGDRLWDRIWLEVMEGE